ncbi:MAG: (S)-ureidoglycine aminohydrolase [Tissierellia bacterium]|nr:(S)-ureidoglycine aminohydrolase [Tissierellia bacterium]
MGYLNNNTGYPEGLLEARCVVKKENYLLLPQDGLVNNSVPGYENCQVSILSSPELGASFADYLVTALEGGKNDKIGGSGIESFLYVVEGEVSVKAGDRQEVLTKGGYIFVPSTESLSFENKIDKSQLFVYRRRYEKIDEYDYPEIIIGNVDDLEWIDYEGMDDCQIKNLLPAGDDYRFDMNMHILRFKPGASHGYIETHIQEHGMLCLTGAGMYHLDGDWMPVEKGDYIFMDAYCPQACYGIGHEDFSYVYSKDCNRDVRL